MTKLEFIDKYIELLKTKIESSKESARIYYANDDYEFGKMEEENRVGYEEELEMFQQIKQDLEAWEVVKDKISITVYYDNEQDYEEDVNSHNAICLNSNLRLQNANNEEEWFVPLTDEESKNFKKVLEKENVKNKR